MHFLTFPYVYLQVVNEFSLCKGGAIGIVKCYIVAGKSYIIHTKFTQEHRENQVHDLIKTPGEI